MKRYNIEHRVKSLLQPIIQITSSSSSFEIEKISFSHWDFNYSYGWRGDFLIASSIIESDNLFGAYKNFYKKMFEIVPYLSFCGQVYIEFINEPFLIHKQGTDVAFFRYTHAEKPVGLIFSEKELKAVGLIRKANLPKEFFLYWKDAVNTYGYSGKILLLCAAIEALTKQNKTLQKIILGKDLYKEIFGKGGIRHRLSHGSYFNESDNKNWVEEIHKRMINYFNREIFKEDLLSEEIANPQRHIFEEMNKYETKFFVKSKKGDSQFSLRELIEEFDKYKFFKGSEKFEYLPSDDQEITDY